MDLEEVLNVQINGTVFTNNTATNSEWLSWAGGQNEHVCATH